MFRTFIIFAVAYTFATIAAVAQPAARPKQTPAAAAAKPKTVGTAKPNQEASDPTAREVLERVRKLYDSYRTTTADFTITAELGADKAGEDKGKLYLKGAKYRVELPEQDFICDGKTRWSVLKKQKETQISNADEADEDGLGSPAELFRIYQKPNFVYALIGEATEGGKAVQKIEFKPVKGFEQYTKVRVTIDKESARMMSLKVFLRDGSRYTLKIANLVPNTNLADTLFEYDKSKYPSMKLINLR